MNTVEVLAAMRADDIPKGSHGLWKVEKRKMGEREVGIMALHGSPGIEPGDYTYLRRYTDATLHVGGEGVMNDAVPELRKHLEACHQARGRVLVTGLGLGCVVRGILSRPGVDRVDVIERDASVLELVEPFMPRDPRLKIHRADALQWVKSSRDRWDVVWHDLWADRDKGEPHLSVIHVELLLELRKRSGWQGAWAFPREYRRLLRGDGVRT